MEWLESTTRQRHCEHNMLPLRNLLLLLSIIKVRVHTRISDQVSLSK